MGPIHCALGAVEKPLVGRGSSSGLRVFRLMAQ